MKRMNLKQLSFVILFCAFIVGLGVISLAWPKETYSRNEKRMLAEPPALTASRVFDGAFAKDIESYISDHFAGREFFVAANAYSNLAVGRNGSNGVYRAADGYLIEKPTENGLAQAMKNFGFLSDFAKSSGLTIDIIMVPTTGYILDDKLPAIHNEYFDDAAFAAMPEESAFNLTDLRETFRQSNEQLYYRTDHHWTTAGAYAAYAEYCAKSGLIPQAAESFDIKGYERFYGTTYGKSCLWLNPPDTLERWEPKQPQSVKYEIFDDNSEWDSLFFEERALGDDKYSAFLDGNHSFVKITNPNADGGKLLILRDSFANALAPFLAAHYSEIYLLDLRYYKKPISELMAEYGIDNVLILYGLNNFAKDDNLAWLK